MASVRSNSQFGDSGTVVPDVSIELNSLPGHETHEQPANDDAELPPTDRGFAAWKLLLVSFVFEALLWGFPLSFGIFQDYYSHLPQYANDPYVSVVGTVASGLSYLGAPLITPVIRRYPQHRRKMIVVGWPICILGLVASSYANSLKTLIITQGFMYGVGFLIFYYPILSMLDEYWIARRGFAYGVMCSASGVSGAAWPLLIQSLLQKYGHQTTLRAIAIALTVLTGPLIPLLKGREKSPQLVEESMEIDWTFIRLPLFWIYSTSNVIQSLGYFFPSLFLPSYATSIGLKGWQGALLLTIMSMSQVVGQITFGYLSDRKVSLNILITVSMLVSSCSTFLLWGIGRSFAPLVCFAMLFGFFAAGYTAMWARMVSAISTDQAAALPMFSVFCFGKGIGNVLAGPISAGLLLPMVKVSRYGAWKYGVVVLFTGAAMLLSGISVSAWYIKGRRWRRVCSFPSGG